MQSDTNFADRYAGMSNGELAELVYGDLDSLTEEARSAFRAELRRRGLTLKELREEYPLELPPDDDEDKSRGSFLQEFGVFGIPIGVVVVLVIYAALLGKPFAVQVTTMVGYTGFVFFPLFCNLRSTKGYDLRQKAVREKLPQLLAIHAVFLAIVFVGLTVALSLRPSLPSSWFLERGRKHESWFSDLLLLMGVVTVAIQVYISRRILSRSVEASQAM